MPALRERIPDQRSAESQALEHGASGLTLPVIERRQPNRTFVEKPSESITVYALSSQTNGTIEDLTIDRQTALRAVRTAQDIMTSVHKKTGVDDQSLERMSHQTGPARYAMVKDLFHPELHRDVRAITEMGEHADTLRAKTEADVRAAAVNAITNLVGLAHTMRPSLGGRYRL